MKSIHPLPTRRGIGSSVCIVCLALLLTAGRAAAQIDLRNATVETFDNGLKLILLEDRRFPVVSVQASYRVGARNEVTGKTGLAHFLEHMAFRDSKHFPGTEIVSQIYAVGGEWHAYTWTDLTNYYSTVPREHVDLLLQIEADRMSNLLLSKEDMKAERGSVLTEMHMYENLPTSMLIDAVNFTSFLAHPYRNNTIGWESDIQNLAHADVVEFYKQHYHPANATIAVVGDFDRTQVRERLAALVSKQPNRSATPAPHTVEPLQDGVRRVTLQAQTSQRQFMIAYRAPSVNSPDYPAFLVLQELLGTGSGVNFQQNDWGTPVLEDSPLFATASSVTSWYPPSAQDYVFIIGGFAPEGSETARVEAQVESQIEKLRAKPVSPAALGQAIDDVQAALVADVQTTEDAAHQLAYFDGLGALDVLLELPQRVAAVTAADVQALAQQYLSPERRSIAWHLPAIAAAENPPPRTANALPEATPRRAPGTHANPAAVVRRLPGGIPVLLQASDFSPLAHLRITLASNGYSSGTRNDPVLNHTSLSYSGLASDIDAWLASARRDLEKLEIAPVEPVEWSSVPDVRMEQQFDALMQAGRKRAPVPAVPVLISAAGDFEPDELLAKLEGSVGQHGSDKERPSVRNADDRSPIMQAEQVIHLGKPLAQAQLGYLVAAPGPQDPLADAYRLLLYILSHDYEGRLGKKAISEAGLAYHIDGRYRSDGDVAWISLSTGVDIGKLPALRALLTTEIARLGTEPPNARELQEAKQHMLGRQQSAAQNNAELTQQLATDWLWYNALQTPETLQHRLDSVSREQLALAAKGFTEGIVLVVTQ